MIHICVGKTLDWGNEAVVSERLRPRFRAKYEMWNATFDMPYACFRRRLKEIAELNLSRVENVSLSSLDDVPPGELIVPVDDDDWFAPDLSTELQKILEPGRAGYLWIRDVIEPPRRPRRFRLRLRRKRRVTRACVSCAERGCRRRRRVLRTGPSCWARGLLVHKGVLRRPAAEEAEAGGNPGT